MNRQGAGKAHGFVKGRSVKGLLSCNQLTLPVSAPRLVHVHMGVNEARRYNQVAVVEDLCKTGEQERRVREVRLRSLPIDGLHCCYLAILHMHCSTNVTISAKSEHL